MGKISATTLVIISTTLVAGVLSASFENLQSPFSILSASGHAVGNPQTHAKRTRSVEGPVQLCGMRLLEAVRGICGHFSGYSRRSDPGMSMSLGNFIEEAARDPSGNTVDLNAENVPQYNGDGYGEGSSDYIDSDNLWNRNPKALALKVLAEGKTHQRYRRNIIDECCKRPCTMSHMLKYCGRT